MMSCVHITFVQARFDAAYDEEEEGGSYFEDLKKEVSEQAEMNRAEFEGMREEVRVQYEGVQPGCYVRMEVKGEGSPSHMTPTFTSHCVLTPQSPSQCRRPL